MTKLQLTGSPRRITPETMEQRVVIAPKEDILMNRNSINNVIVESFLDELKKTLQELQIGDLLF